MSTHSCDPVDPDPFTIAQTLFGAAALVLQLLAMRKDKPSDSNYSPPSQNLLHLETAVDNMRAKSQKILRTLDHGVRDVDGSFYDRPFRVGTAPMMLDYASHQIFSKELMELSTVAGQMGSWINHVIANEPELASRLGARLHQNLGDIVDRLNTIMEKGLPNREAVQAEKEAIDALSTAIESELRRRN
jgi:hypothetical protein